MSSSFFSFPSPLPHLIYSFYPLGLKARMAPTEKLINNQSVTCGHQYQTRVQDNVSKCSSLWKSLGSHRYGFSPLLGNFLCMKLTKINCSLQMTISLQFTISQSTMFASFSLFSLTLLATTPAVIVILLCNYNLLLR